HRGRKNVPREPILLGFSDRPWLEPPLFAVFLVSYIVTIFGNLAIILVSQLDPKLHPPTYFFLPNLSLRDLCYTTGTVPQMLVNTCSGRKAISYGGCVAQLFMFLALGSTECLLLAVMSFHRFVAICPPLRYSVIMHRRLCLQLAAASWLSGFGNSGLQSTWTLQLPLCGRREVDSFFCEVPALLKLSCVDTTANEAELFFISVLVLLLPVTLILISCLVSVAWGVGLLNSLVMSPVTMTLPRCGRCEVKHFLCEMPALIKIACVDTVAVESTVFILSVMIVLGPLALILVSYSYIALAVLSMRSATGRRKAFTTCGSHLTVVSLFYGNIVYMYMQPGQSSSQDQGKFLTLFCNLVTPMLNPVVYTLRNKDVKGALRRLVKSGNICVE
uniref:Olfactory receptor n=1 Tax=Ailuropoda melanoleuca TaxID=9646 RepID=A0A7N5KME5_AILME